MARSTFANPMAAFFALYPSFKYNRTASSSASEFSRLCRFKGWERDDNEQKAAWCEFQNAVAKLFNGVYGTDVDSLMAWQKLCRRVNIDPPPDVLEEAREAVYNTHVNLMDLAEVELRPGRKVQTWPTEAALAAYTKRTGRIVSSSSPMAGGLLKALLRHIFHPPARDLRRDHTGNYIRGRSRNPATNQGISASGNKAGAMTPHTKAGANDAAGGETKKKTKSKAKGKNKKKHGPRQAQATAAAARANRQASRKFRSKSK